MSSKSTQTMEPLMLSLNFQGFEEMQNTIFHLVSIVPKQDMKPWEPLSELSNARSFEFKASVLASHKYASEYRKDLPEDLEELISGVYKGKLNRGDQQLDAVCKLVVADEDDMAAYDALRREANAYELLLKAWGDIVPHYFGCFEGNCHVIDNTLDPVPVRCILLEDCGDAFDPYGKLLRTPDYKGREICLELLMCLHKLGISMGEIPRYQFVRNSNGYVKMIDFPDAVEHHVCLQEHPVPVWTFAAPNPINCCEEIYDAADTFCLYVLTTLTVAGFSVELHGAPDKDEITEYLRKRPEFEDQDIDAWLDDEVERAVTKWMLEWERCIPFITGKQKKALVAAVLQQEYETDEEAKMWP